jgi:hypothetical protein
VSLSTLAFYCNRPTVIAALDLVTAITAQVQPKKDEESTPLVQMVKGMHKVLQRKKVMMPLVHQISTVRTTMGGVKKLTKRMGMTRKILSLQLPVPKGL